jgi:hypothetical protein
LSKFRVLYLPRWRRAEIINIDNAELARLAASGVPGDRDIRTEGEMEGNRGLPGVSLFPHLL